MHTKKLKNLVADLNKSVDETAAMALSLETQGHTQLADALWENAERHLSMRIRVEESMRRRDRIIALREACRTSECGY
jgi:hypothetical protein